jgi:hypothetical protein
MGSRLGVILTALILLASTTLLDAQIAIPDFRVADGPWECVDSTGVHGIFLSGHSRLSISEGRQTILWLSQSIFIYRRQGRSTQGGYFMPNRTDATSTSSFDGKHLKIHFTNNRLSNISPFDLDITFDPTAKRWVGSWSFCEKAGGAVLERPHPRDGVRPHVLVGDWEEGPISGLGADHLKIRESMDGTLMGWFDASVSGHTRNLAGTQSDETDETLGRIAVMKSTSTNKIVFEISDGVWFEGTLSPDGKIISGVWNNEGLGVGPTEGKRPTISTVYRQRN